MRTGISPPLVGCDVALGCRVSAATLVKSRLSLNVRHHLSLTKRDRDKLFAGDRRISFFSLTSRLLAARQQHLVACAIIIISVG